MGDDKGGAPGHQILQPDLNQTLILGIERRCCLIQQQQGRIAQKRARNGKALTLAAGQGHPAFPHPRVVAIGQADDEFLCGRRLRRLAHGAVVRIGVAIADIVGNAAGENNRVLRH